MDKMECFKEPLKFDELKKFEAEMPMTLSHIHILIKEIQKRQLVLRMICMRCKGTYREHLDQIVEVDTVGKATLSYRTYKFLLDDEMKKKAATEAFMEKSRQEGEDLAAWKIKLVALEYSMWCEEH